MFGADCVLAIRSIAVGAGIPLFTEPSTASFSSAVVAFMEEAELLRSGCSLVGSLTDLVTPRPDFGAIL
jgi:hypothetical protein